MSQPIIQRIVICFPPEEDPKVEDLSCILCYQKFVGDKNAPLIIAKLIRDGIMSDGWIRYLSNRNPCPAMTERIDAFGVQLPPSKCWMGFHTINVLHLRKDYPEYIGDVFNSNWYTASDYGLFPFPKTVILIQLTPIAQTKSAQKRKRCLKC